MLQFPTWKVVLIGLVCFLGAVFAAPNLVPRDVLERLPAGIPANQINLGLDLRGGSHILLEMDTQAILEDRLDTLQDDLRSQLRRAGVKYSGLGIVNNQVFVTIDDPGAVEQVVNDVRADLDSTQFDALSGSTIRLLDITVEGNRIAVAYTDEAFEAQIQAALVQSIEIVRRRIDETGTREPTIQRQGDNRILVQLPGVDDPERVKNLLGQTARLTFRMVDTQNSAVTAETTGRVPAGSVLYPALEPEPGEPRSYLVQRRIMVSGESLVDAQPTFDQGQPVVSFRFDNSGARRFATATSENVGRPFAIVLDDHVITAPVIREPILGGSGIISGRFTVEGAQDLALLLRAGALPAPLEVVEERTVGPGLGADSIAAGEAAAVLGLALVLIFMVIGYGRFGIYADIALAVNLILIVGALSLLQATLTLPGIAGIVLTIGMAVDANVLVFERIREEIANGRGPVSAIDSGYKRAVSTIIDANLTTFIAAVLLYALGSGPVKGFAVTLSIGLLTSMFTALMVTRYLVASWYKAKRPQTLPI
ncbi:MAG: protein translocase subunit SecD [Alphaproteobacteria bacterium]|nr:protein translocase subunit SecD [Alphaproteobacteria bacterium]